jgi:predicted permease
VIAFLFLVLNIKLPFMVTDTLQKMANVTTPLSFVVLGASLSLGGFRRNLPRLCGAGIVRLILVPGLCLSAGLLLGLRGTHIATMVCLMGAPVAVSSFTLAQTYGADESLAAEIVTATTLAAAVTMFCWITLLNQFALI